MKNTEKVKTQDGQEVANGENIWYVNGDTIHGAALQIGRHDRQYKIYKSKTLALREAAKCTSIPKNTNNENLPG